MAARLVVACMQAHYQSQTFSNTLDIQVCFGSPVPVCYSLLGPKQKLHICCQYLMIKQQGAGAPNYTNSQITIQPQQYYF